MGNLRGDERGQALVVVIVSMFVVLAFAALAIDASAWYQKHHTAQVAADAAALAAANCLADASTTNTTANTCTSTSDTNAQNVATTIASANGYSTATVSVGTSAVTVSVSTPAPTFFAGMFNLGPTVSAKAVAGFAVGSGTNCTTPGSACYAVFAMDTACTDSSSTPGSPIILNGSGDTIQGNVHSNGSMDEVGGTQHLGATSYGNGTGCTLDTNGSSGDTWDGSSTKPSTGIAPITTWPNDFSKTLTACGGAGQVACTGPDGTPSYCTEAAGSAGSSSINSASASGFDYGSPSEDPPTGNVWCAYGTGTPSNPTTWNGLIYFQSNNTTVSGSWIGGTIEFGRNGWNLSPLSSEPNWPVLYALGSGNCSSASSGGICMSGGGQTINGSLFAPNGTIQFNGAGTTTDNFLEGKDIDFVGGSQSIIGTGPMGSSQSASTGMDWLTQ